MPPAYPAPAAGRDCRRAALLVNLSVLHSCRRCYSSEHSVGASQSPSPASQLFKQISKPHLHRRGTAPAGSGFPAPRLFGRCAAGRWCVSLQHAAARHRCNREEADEPWSELYWLLSTPCFPLSTRQKLDHSNPANTEACALHTWMQSPAAAARSEPGRPQTRPSCGAGKTCAAGPGAGQGCRRVGEGQSVTHIAAHSMGCPCYCSRLRNQNCA